MRDRHYTDTINPNLIAMARPRVEEEKTAENAARDATSSPTKREAGANASTLMSFASLLMKSQPQRQGSATKLKDARQDTTKEPSQNLTW